MAEQGTSIPFADRPLLVLALGGNALSPPATSAEDYAPERRIVRATGVRLGQLADAGYRLLIVHGNGPQVGRLLRQDPAHGNLDIHIAQTQGELGYLIARSLDTPAVGLITRVVVAADPGPPVKPVGPVLATRPDGPAARTGEGWRITVPSPRPREVLEQQAIRILLANRHVIAGGGGGIPQTAAGAPVSGVVDKDWVAALLAIALDARHLVFATDVDGVYRRRELTGSPIDALTADAALELVVQGVAAQGSMAPKLESAAAFAGETGRPARICALEDVEAALAGRAGTRIDQGDSSVFM